MSNVYLPHVHAKLLQSCLTLCDPMDYSLPHSSIHGILQARMLELHFPTPGGYCLPRNQTQVLCLLHWQVGSLPLGLPGKLYVSLIESQFLNFIASNLNVNHMHNILENKI